mmetsp:Transcript_3776/g.5708  ORF Transcript_3776/g.5708 Transcript_3776/m.5708 type:complete len:1181 (-) Transcript_3776:131-3673(-)
MFRNHLDTDQVCFSAESDGPVTDQGLSLITKDLLQVVDSSMFDQDEKSVQQRTVANQLTTDACLSVDRVYLRRFGQQSPISLPTASSVAVERMLMFVLQHLKKKHAQVAEWLEALKYPLAQPAAWSHQNWLERLETLRDRWTTWTFSNRTDGGPRANELSLTTWPEQAAFVAFYLLVIQWKKSTAENIGSESPELDLTLQFSKFETDTNVSNRVCPVLLTETGLFDGWVKDLTDPQSQHPTSENHPNQQTESGRAPAFRFSVIQVVLGFARFCETLLMHQELKLLCSVSAVSVGNETSEAAWLFWRHRVKVQGKQLVSGKRNGFQAALPKVQSALRVMQRSQKLDYDTLRTWIENQLQKLAFQPVPSSPVRKSSPDLEGFFTVCMAMYVTESLIPDLLRKLKSGKLRLTLENESPGDVAFLVVAGTRLQELLRRWRVQPEEGQSKTVLRYWTPDVVFKFFVALRLCGSVVSGASVFPAGSEDVLTDEQKNSVTNLTNELDALIADAKIQVYQAETQRLQLSELNEWAQKNADVSGKTVLQFSKLSNFNFEANAVDTKVSIGKVVPQIKDLYLVETLNQWISDPKWSETLENNIRAEAKFEEAKTMAGGVVELYRKRAEKLKVRQEKISAKHNREVQRQNEAQRRSPVNRYKELLSSLKTMVLAKLSDKQEFSVQEHLQNLNNPQLSNRLPFLVGTRASLAKKLAVKVFNNQNEKNSSVKKTLRALLRAVVYFEMPDVQDLRRFLSESSQLLDEKAVNRLQTLVNKLKRNITKGINLLKNTFIELLEPQQEPVNLARQHGVPLSQGYFGQPVGISHAGVEQPMGGFPAGMGESVGSFQNAVDHPVGEFAAGVGQPLVETSEDFQRLVRDGYFITSGASDDALTDFHFDQVFDEVWNDDHGRNFDSGQGLAGHSWQHSFDVLNKPNSNVRDGDSNVPSFPNLDYTPFPSSFPGSFSNSFPGEVVGGRYDLVDEFVTQAQNLQNAVPLGNEFDLNGVDLENEHFQEIVLQSAQAQNAIDTEGFPSGVPILDPSPEPIVHWYARPGDRPPIQNADAGQDTTRNAIEHNLGKAAAANVGGRFMNHDVNLRRNENGNQGQKNSRTKGKKRVPSAKLVVFQKMLKDPWHLFLQLDALFESYKAFGKELDSYLNIVLATANVAAGAVPSGVLSDPYWSGGPRISSSNV